MNLFGKKRKFDVQESPEATETDAAVTVFNALSIPICILDETNRIQYSNAAMCSHFGKSPSEINGKYFSQAADGYSIAEPDYVKTMKQSGSAVTEIVEINDRWFEITVSPLAELSGKSRRTVQLTREIPGVKAINREVVSKYLQKLHVSIVGAVCCDLMNRLMSISGHMQLLERKCDDPEKKAKYFKISFEAIESMVEFIKKLREIRFDPDSIDT